MGLKLDGDVGLLPDNEYYAGMDVDPAGKLHAIVGPAFDARYYGPTCVDGCSVVRIDVASGTVEESVPFDFEQPSFDLVVRADPQGGILLACAQASSIGYRVMLLPDAP